MASNFMFDVFFCKPLFNVDFSENGFGRFHSFEEIFFSRDVKLRKIFNSSYVQNAHFDGMTKENVHLLSNKIVLRRNFLLFK